MAAGAGVALLGAGVLAAGAEEGAVEVEELESPEVVVVLDEPRESVR